MMTRWNSQQEWKSWQRKDNKEKSTLTYGGANDDRYHLTSTSPFCTSSWASEVEERTKSLSFPQEYMHSVLPTDSDLKVENIVH